LTPKVCLQLVVDSQNSPNALCRTEDDDCEDESDGEEEGGAEEEQEPEEVAVQDWLEKRES
jgi:hypothetical protein